MSYISAEDVLPEELIKTIQQYVSGKSIQRIIRNIKEGMSIGNDEIRNE